MSRHYRAPHLGRSRTPTRRRAARYGAPVMCGMAVTAGAQVCRLSDTSGVIGVLRIPSIAMGPVSERIGDG